MPYVVTQSCCADASCVVACPVNCIHPTPGEPGFATAEMLFVDAATCVGCGACATACPVDAVKPHTSLTADEQPFLQLNADYYAVFPHRDRAPVAVMPPQRRLRRPGPFRVAVVGAGPAGLYTADELLRHPEVAGVDVYDRLPTPHGLVRAGVAPDHQHTKRVQQLFATIETQPGFGYVLAVEVGRDVSLADLAAGYDAVVHAGGAAADRTLGVEGEHLPGSLSATDLVGWYNGHPDKQDLDVPLHHERAVVVGNGNVALDVARILTADPDELERTDIATLPATALRRSAVREVVVLGRRGPAQAAFTVPELVGLVALADRDVIDVVVDTGGAPIEPGDDPTRAPALRLLADLAGRPRTPGRRAIVLRFLTQPARIVGDAHGVTGVEVVRTRLEVDATGRPVAVPDGEPELLEAGLVLRSVGYHGQPVPGLPYDAARGVVPNEGGRVRPGVYVAGWIKRGPTGFIGTNKADAEETVAALLDDLDAGLTPSPTRDAAEQERWLDTQVPHRIGLAGWQAIDAEERRRGETRGRPRTKIVAVDELRRVAQAGVAATTSPRRRRLARVGG